VSLVILQLEILELESKDGPDLRVKLDLWQGVGLARELQTRLLQVIAIQVDIAESVDKITRLQVAYLGHHVSQQGIRSDVERHAKEDIRNAGKAGRRPTIGDRTEQSMTGLVPDHLAGSRRADQQAKRLGFA
jgi:hypothetical protein